ncbi:hypothetical protein BC940DRAFT_351138 [Gongronella butleri]|nr:hypothetical protein BC940DRAFT_351138 [Gongronella butleri]
MASVSTPPIACKAAVYSLLERRFAESELPPLTDASRTVDKRFGVDLARQATRRSSFLACWGAILGAILSPMIFTVPRLEFTDKAEGTERSRKVDHAILGRDFILNRQSGVFDLAYHLRDNINQAISQLGLRLQSPELPI